MSWPEITVKDLPLVLAGPILRKVSSTSVSVWLALKSEASVFLTVKDASDKAVASTDPIGTLRIGENLHLAFLTAVLKDEKKPLVPGVVYRYSVGFTVGTKSFTLASATNNASLAYPTQTLPTFVLPPKKIDDLRIIQGSCRKPHGESTDALEILDDLIAVDNDDARARPHLLLLGGDQIYADDVADDLLTAISDTAKKLMGWEETVKDGGSTKVVGGTWLPGGALRSEVVKLAGSTSDDVKTQLMSLGEYMTMYLYAWSDVLWPTSPLTGGGQADHVEHYRKALPKVRRALANIPTYMIFDDHEVIDDFNMSRKFCDGIYGSAMGRRIIMNGLVAYTLCQAWGNKPSLEVNKITRQLIGVNKDSAYEAVARDLAMLVGVEDKTALAGRKPYGLSHSFGGYDYEYTVEGEAFQIVVTDTRTWRAFPGGADEHALLIPDNLMRAQIDSTDQLGDRVLIVVLTTNAPPISSFRVAASHPSFIDPHSNDTIDAWELPSLSTDQLLVHLTEKFKPDAKGDRAGRAVIISGDVHFSFASRLQYWADKRLGDTTKASTKVVFAQLVSSALKNEKGDTRGLHTSGYTYVPDMKGVRGNIKQWFAESIVPPTTPEAFAGWNVDVVTRVGRIASGGSVAPSPEQPTIKVDPDMRFTSAPDYRYVLEYLSTAAASSYPGSPPAVGPIKTPVLDRGQVALAGYKQAAMAYRDYAKAPGKARQIVGKNNLGEITFKWGADNDKTVHYTMRWREAAKIEWARYAVSMSLDDTKKPKLPGVG